MNPLLRSTKRTLTCPQCNSPVKVKGAGQIAHCSYCGTNFSGTEVSFTNMPARRSGLFYVGSTLIVLLIISVIVLSLLVSHYSSESAAQRELAYQQGQADALASTHDVEISERAVISVEMLHESLASASKLTTFEYYYTATGKYKKDPIHTIFNIPVPFTTDEALYTYSGKIGAGIILDDVNFIVDNNEENKSITILFPEPKILSNELDSDSLEFYDVKKSVFNRSTFNDYEQLRSSVLKDREEALLKNTDFWAAVRDHTELVVKNLITATGQLDEYTILCQWPTANS